MTQPQAIIEAFKALGGTRNKHEIEGWVSQKYGDTWKDCGTPMADMVPISRGGNKSSKKSYVFLKEFPLVSAV